MSRPRRRNRRVPGWDRLLAGTDEIETGELGAGADIELPEYVAQVEVDRPRAEEQLGCHLSVAEALGHEVHDLEFLCGELVRGTWVTSPGHLPAGAQLRPCALGPKPGSQSLEAVESGAQVLTRINSTAGTPEQLTKGEFSAGTLERTGGLGVRVQ